MSSPLGSARQLRPRPIPPPASALPAHAPNLSLLQGPRHGGDRIAELHWPATSAVWRGAFADPWVSADQRASMPSHLGVVVTYAEHAGLWRPQTVVTEAATRPGEWGYYAARRLTDAEPIGAMLDLHTPSGPSNFLVRLQGRVQDGAASRLGGPTRANDPRGTGLASNALLHGHGWLSVKPGATIEALSPRMSPAERRRAEITYSYGSAYWAGNL